MLSVVVLAYGKEAFLADAINAVLASQDVDLEVIVVDNGCTSTAVTDIMEKHPGIRLLKPARNLGFAGGVNLGAEHASGTTIGLVNSDAIVEPNCLAQLVHRAEQPDVGVAGALVLLAEGNNAINSAGNPVHVLGLCWAGRMGQDAAVVPALSEQPTVSGACMVLRREVWNSLGGFPGEFFAYLEDMELSWRCWQHGLRVELVGTARCRHHYEFSRSPLKMYLLERNRLLFLATCYGGRTLALLAVPLIGFEIAILLVAFAQGWGSKKIAGWRWMLMHPRWIYRRRAVVQSSRTLPDAALARLLTDEFDPAEMSMPPAANFAQALLKAWWRFVRRFV